MAHYDRQILVPYLRDVCSVEMLCQKLEQDIRHAKAEADKYAGWANAKYVDPPKPRWSDYQPKADLENGCLSTILIGGSFLLGLATLGIPLIGLTLIGAGCIFSYISYLVYREAQDAAEERWQSALNKYNDAYAKNKANRAKQPAWRETSQQWRKMQNELTGKMNEAKDLRTSVYSVNIIPSRYRTIHAAYYLYDFFSSGRETDLERTIQTMLLDEIVQRMDKLIAQNQEIILNQRMLLAQQEQRNRDDDDRHLDQMRHIAQIEENQQRQTDYQNMIARNQQVTNFFLAADYLRKNR